MNDASALTTNKPLELQNTSQYPRIFYAKHIQPGLCRYEGGDDGDEMLLIEHEALTRMAPSFVGKPVYIVHPKSGLDERLPNLKEEASGYVTDSFYNPSDGWFWVKFLLIDDAAHDCVEQGWAVSNGYVPTERGNGGVWHNVPFNSEVMNAAYTQLALVPNPRYEDACIFTPEEYRIYNSTKLERQNELLNSKGADDKTEGAKTMQLFKSKREAVTTIDADTEIELANGKSMKISDMVASVEKAEAEKEKLNSLNTATVEVGGKKMTVAELVEKHNSMCEEKENENDPEDRSSDDNKPVKQDMVENQNADDEDDELENEADDGDDKGEPAADDEKKNAKEAKAIKAAAAKLEGEKHFRELKNASHTSVKAPILETTMDQVARGKSRYGSEITKH